MQDPFLLLQYSTKTFYSVANTWHHYASIYQLKNLHQSVAITAAEATSLMSEEQLKAFIAKAKDDQSIQEQLKAANTPEDVVDIAKEHGHDFATEHMSQLSEQELEGVTGGAGAGCIITPITGQLNPSEACDTHGYANLGQVC